MTKNTNQMESYYENESEQFAFYRVPKLLFKDKRFSEISSDAKLLYALFLDRMSLAVENGWIDEEKRVYIHFPIEEITEEFGIGTQKAVKIIAELSDIDGCGLIHRKIQGQGKPARIYLMKYTSVNSDSEPEIVEDIPEEISDIDERFGDKESKKYMESFILDGTLDNPKKITFSPQNHRISEIESQEF